MVTPILPATNVPSMVKGSGTGSELSSVATSVELKAPSQILILPRFGKAPSGKPHSVYA